MKKLKFVLKMEENIMGKGENVGDQHFLFFSECFQKVSFMGLCGKELSPNTAL